MKGARFAVVARTRDRREALARCLASAAAQVEDPPSCEIVVLDDASTDGTREAVPGLFRELGARGFARLHLERRARPVQIAASAALAMGLVSAAVEWTLLIDDDAELAPGALRALREAARGRPRAAVVGPRIEDPARPGRFLFGPRWVGGWTGRYREHDPPSAHVCDWLVTTCWLVNMEAYRKAGGFPADFHMSHWEVDFCLRAGALGYQVVYEPQALCLHPTPPGMLREERLYYLYRNKALVLWRNFSGPRLWTALAFYAGPTFLNAWAEALTQGRLLHRAPILGAAFRDGLLGRAGPREGGP